MAGAIALALAGCSDDHGEAAATPESECDGTTIEMGECVTRDHNRFLQACVDGYLGER